MTPQHRTTRFRSARWALGILALAATAALPAGCNIVGPVAYLIEGPPTVDAVYELDKERITVIFIDDRLNRAPRRSLRIVAAEKAEQVLMEKKILPSEKVITTRAIMRQATQEQFTKPMTIAELGRSVGAEVVIYLTIDSWSLSSDGVVLSPTVTGRVKIIDATNDTRLWPPDGNGHRLTASLPPQTSDMPTGAERDQSNQVLADRLGLSLAQLFYEHERDTLSGKLDD